MSSEACVTCSAPIENTAATGIFCEPCFDAENTPAPGWRAWLSGPSITGLGACVAGLVFTVTVNGVNYVAAGAGAVAVVAGGLGVAGALQGGPAKRKAAIGGGLVVLVGLYLLTQSGLWLLLG